jgi:hypothetical protein
MDHLEEHIKQSHWPPSCPHPLCDLQLNDEESFYYHLIDIHSLCHRKEYGKEEKNNPQQNEDLGNQKRKRLGGDTQNGKKQKVTHVEEVHRIDFIKLLSPKTCAVF